MSILTLTEQDAPPLALGLDDAPVFQPLTDEEAAGIARRASALKAEADCIRANAKAMVEELESRLEWLLQAEDQRLREWIARGKPGAKSRRTYWGLLGTRATGGGLKIEDLDAAINYARILRPEAVLTTVTVDVKKLRVEETVDTETGEMRPVPPPGFRWDAPVSRLYVQPLPRGKNGQEGDES